MWNIASSQVSFQIGKQEIPHQYQITWECWAILLTGRSIELPSSHTNKLSLSGCNYWEGAGLIRTNRSWNWEIELILARRFQMQLWLTKGGNHRRCLHGGGRFTCPQRRSRPAGRDNGSRSASPRREVPNLPFTRHSAPPAHRHPQR